MKYLIDTNILIYLMNTKSVKLQKKFSGRRTEEFGVSAITVAELMFGVKKSKHIEKNISAVIMILSPFKIIDFTTVDAFEYGDIRADLEAKGQMIGANDLLIAAQARSRNLIIVTANEREYKRVPGLNVENWA